jgi:hypothetical protein
LTAYVPGTSETDLKKIILAIQQLAAGRSNAVGVVTLIAGAASTVVSDQNCAAGSAVKLNPMTANAAAALATTYWTAANRSFTIFHANNAQTDRTFTYAIQG